MEGRLDQCIHQGVGINNCGHGEDAGVFCQRKMVVNTVYDCRLTNSAVTSLPMFVLEELFVLCGDSGQFFFGFDSLGSSSDM